MILFTKLFISLKTQNHFFRHLLASPNHPFLSECHNLTSDCQAVTDGKLWCMERLVFQQIMQSTGIKKTENQVML